MEDRPGAEPKPRPGSGRSFVANRLTNGSYGRSFRTSTMQAGSGTSRTRGGRTTRARSRPSITTHIRSSEPLPLSMVAIMEHIAHQAEEDSKDLTQHGRARYRTIPQRCSRGSARSFCGPQVVGTPGVRRVRDGRYHPGRFRCASEKRNDIEGAANANKKLRVSSFAAVLVEPHEEPLPDACARHRPRLRLQRVSRFVGPPSDRQSGARPDGAQEHRSC